MKATNLSEKYHATLKGVAIGDALGLPFETHTRDQVLNLLNQEYFGAHGGLIRQYYPIGRHAQYRKHFTHPHFLDLHANSTGICSDDTLLTLVISDSIHEKGGIDMDDIIARHIQAVTDEPFGFGKGTRTSIERVASGVDWRKLNDVSFGNGVMMKQMPFAFYQCSTGISSLQELLQLTNITHSHPVSIVATQIHHKLLVDILLSDTRVFDMGYWLTDAYTYAQNVEKRLYSDRHISDLIKSIHEEKDDELTLSEIGKRYVRHVDNEKNAYFNVLSTIGIVYAIWLRKQDFEAVQFGASIGGDTDSYASILGSLVGALHGNVFEKSWL